MPINLKSLDVVLGGFFPREEAPQGDRFLGWSNKKKSVIMNPNIFFRENLGATQNLYATYIVRYHRKSIARGPWLF